MAAPAQSNGSRLVRYVPRIATNWDTDAPGRLFQELDATLCFVDISGFTNLSEKLAQRGRIGAEELTAVLNFVFSKMLEIAYRQGGSLLKFGGDALLLMYAGDDHATRAASAAVEMRSALRAASEYQTTVGRLRLRMSVGIHSGQIHIFRAGMSHQEIVIAGRGGTITTQMEKTADPGEILVSAGTRDLLADGAIGDAKGEGWLLRWRKAHCAAEGPVVREVTGDLDALREWVPESLRDYLSAGETEPEHRIASVGFVRFCRVDEHMESDGPDWVAQAIGETMASIEDAADAEEITFLATDINEDGGKAILVAGAPVARAEDEGRILRALRRVADADLPLDVHIGVNRGHVFTGEVGTEFRATYTVMGDTVNLAARLMAAAPARAIYATPSILDQSSTVFATTPLEPLHVKGKSEPVKAYSVGEETGSRSTTSREELPFVGRSEELEALTSALQRASEGRGSVITVVGDAGFGKTRLVERAAESFTEMQRIVVRAEPYGSATPYRPLRDPVRSALGIERAPNDEMVEALRTALGRIAPDLLPMAPLIGDVAHIEVPETPEVSEIEPRFRQARTADVVTELLDTVLTDPVLLHVEDAQWMDDASEHVLDGFVRTVAERSWAIIVTRRPSDGGFSPDGEMTLDIHELSSDDAEQLVVAATTATPLHPHEVDAIVARSGGNPLFVGEMLRIVAETGSTEELPDSLGTLVSTSIDALPTLTRRILRYASVLGRSFRTSTVRAILEEDQLELDAATRESLDEFIESAGSGRLQFRTAMVRDVAYSGLSYRRRTELHRRAARAIAATATDEPESAADQLAMHYFLGNDYEGTWRFARIAAERAMRAYANAEAATQLERALEAARRLPELPAGDVAETWMQLGDVRERAGIFDGAFEAYRHASRIVEDPISRADLLLKRASVRERAGRYPNALSESTRASHLVGTVAGAEADETVARATAFQALVRLRQGRLGKALERARAAADLAEPIGDRKSLARAYSVMAWTHVMSDDPGALGLCQRALELYEEVGDLAGQNHMNNNLGYLAYFDGRWNDALAYYERSRDGAERLGNVVDAGFAEANIGEVLVNQRRFDEAEVRLTHAIRVLRATGESSMAAFAELQLARIHVERGEFDRAGTFLADVIREARQAGFTTNAVEGALHQADCFVRIGDGNRALRQIDAAMAEAGEEAAMFTLMEARLRALALGQLGRVDEAARIITDALEDARQRELLYDEALLLQARAALLAGSPADADADISAATRIMDRLGIVTENLV